MAEGIRRGSWIQPCRGLAWAALLLTPFFLFHVSLGQTCGSQAGGALCQNELCCSQYGYCGSTSDYCGTGCQSQCSSTPSSPGGGSGVGSIVTSDIFDSIFPNRNSFYTYDAFISALGKFPSFGTTGDSMAELQDIAAFFAHVFHETSGLTYLREIDQSDDYCQTTNTQYPCATGQFYYGRGPLQITWNYNYGPAGDFIGQDLLNNPDLVAQDAVVSFQSALWFWTTAQPPKPSCEQAIDGTWQPTAADVAAGREPGFGVTIDIINGGIECGMANSAAADRVTQYQNICGILNVSPGSNVDCQNMQPFS